MISLPIYYKKQEAENNENSLPKTLRQNLTILIFAFTILFSLFASNFRLNMLTSFVSSHILSPLQTEKSDHEVFGFAPYWTFDKLDNVDFDVLTTFAYFGIDVDSEGLLDINGTGYEVFQSEKATSIFRKAHDHGARVVLTLTQMDNYNINSILENPDSQERMISKAVELVKSRGIDGINVDFEYTGNPGQEYRDKFTNLVSRLTNKMHAEIPSSKVTVSVYASAIKDPKIYDIGQLSQISDGIFMMAYDFAVTGSDNAIPTSPLYGHKEGKYWYDVSTAVEDFLRHMPADKLILGVPYYGYNYLVYEPAINARTIPYWSWRGQPVAQTYSLVQNELVTEKSGWDNLGKVNWKAYYDADSYTWRMIFLDDSKSLAIKYDFAKEKKLKGVGMWALGFDDGKQELWALLRSKFGNKLADNSVINRKIN